MNNIESEKLDDHNDFPCSHCGRTYCFGKTIQMTHPVSKESYNYLLCSKCAAEHISDIRDCTGSFLRQEGL